MDLALLETLLFQGESVHLDLKQEQYRFARATDQEKSDLLKDILAMANASKTSDAYILIGAAEQRGTKAAILGVVEHLSDHDLQFIEPSTEATLRLVPDAALPR